MVTSAFWGGVDMIHAKDQFAGEILRVCRVRIIALLITIDNLARTFLILSRHSVVLLPHYTILFIVAGGAIIVREGLRSVLV